MDCVWRRAYLCVVTSTPEAEVSQNNLQPAMLLLGRMRQQPCSSHHQQAPAAGLKGRPTRLKSGGSGHRPTQGAWQPADNKWIHAAGTKQQLSVAASNGAGGTQPWSLQESGTRLEWQRPDLHMVLVHPQIPQNAGNVARTCAATGVALHLVEPLGFSIDDKQLKRAGLDYWHSVAVQTHASWKAFYDFFKSLPQPKRLVAFTVFGDQYYGGPEFRYEPGDWLLFGAETSGLPPEAHHDVVNSGGALVKIPILDTHVRSLNLAVCAGVGVFEAVRQLDAGQHKVQSRPSPSYEETMTKYFPDSSPASLIRPSSVQKA